MHALCRILTGSPADCRHGPGDHKCIEQNVNGKYRKQQPETDPEDFIRLSEHMLIPSFPCFCPSIRDMANRPCAQSQFFFRGYSVVYFQRPIMTVIVCKLVVYTTIQM